MQEKKNHTVNAKDRDDDREIIIIEHSNENDITRPREINTLIWVRISNEEEEEGREIFRETKSNERHQ